MSENYQGCGVIYPGPKLHRSASVEPGIQLFIRSYWGTIHEGQISR